MIFERSSPSCYSSQALAALVERSRGGIVMTGFAGGAVCLSTLIDAFHRNHKVTHLCDASASHALDETPADELHHAVWRVSRVYGALLETDEWTEHTSPS
jgi:nicotinamidase-related amidase